MKRLEHEADVARARGGAAVLVEAVSSRLQQHLPARRRVEAGEDREQRRPWPAPERDDRERLPAPDREADVRDDGHAPSGLLTSS